MKVLPSALPRNLLESANNVSDAVFSSLMSSYAFTALFLFVVMFILLKSYGGREGTESLDLRKRRLLGIASGIIGITLFLSLTLLRFFVDRPNVLVLFFFLVPLFYSFVPAFASATFLHAFDAADRGERESFVTAVSEGTVFFRALFLFFLLTGGIGFIRSLFMDLVWYPPFRPFQISNFLIEFSILPFLIMVSFIPLLIVIHKLSLKAAIDKCINLWASQWKNLLAFIAAGALLLLIPVALESSQQVLEDNSVLIGIGGVAGWSVQVMKISLGAFLLSSFVVFLKELQE